MKEIKEGRNGEMYVYGWKTQHCLDVMSLQNNT